MSPTDRLIPVYQPDLSGHEKEYVLECLDSTWISSKGRFIDAFENAFAARLGQGVGATSVCNGTVALHLALEALGIGAGDEVIVPTFTYIASVNTITQTGALPVFAECDPATWLLDPNDVAARLTPKTKALMAVHLYGGACDMTALSVLSKNAGLYLIEDCAEAFGTTLNDRAMGTFGDVGTFSFFGNKTLTTGEGGMVTTANPALLERMRSLKNQGMSPTRRYWHDCLGYNYRMTNIEAAIGLAQIERLDATLARKREIASFYRTKLSGLPLTFPQVPKKVKSSEWLVSFLLPDGVSRDAVMDFLAQRGIETRPVFHCAHQMPMYNQSARRFPVSETIAARGISLPSYPSLTEHDLNRVCKALEESLKI